MQPPFWLNAAPPYKNLVLLARVWGGGLHLVLGLRTGFNFVPGPVHRSNSPPGPGPDRWTG